MPNTFLQPGKIVVILAGRYAGRKAVIVRVITNSADRKFGHCIVAGIDKYPRKVTRSMAKKTVQERSHVKPFVKYVNFNHIMPTRYNLDVSDKLRELFNDTTLNAEEARTEARKQVKKIFEVRYANMATAMSEKAATGVAYFFKKLRF